MNHFLTGSEMEVDSFRIAVAGPEFGETIDDVVARAVKETNEKLQQVFGTEVANKVVRVQSREGKSTFMITASFEEMLYTKVTAYIEKVVRRTYLPIVFSFNNFLSFEPLRVVNTDNDKG